MAPLLIGKELNLEFPTRSVLKNITLGIEEGNRIGIVGKNGDGKSSLLRLLSGELSPDSGEVTKRSDVTVGKLDQIDVLDPSLSALEAATGQVAGHEWASERKSREIVEELLKDIDFNAPVETLSGGQRRRVALARLLIGNWDVLMLDEPTNHLDMEAIAWLANHLKQRWSGSTGALLVVTHDRWFLDEVCTTMWEVHDRQVSPFEGGYSAYVLQRVERDRLAELAEQKRQNLMRKELAWLSRGPQARATKPKFHLKTARALIESEPPPRDSLALKRAAMARLGKQVIELEHAGMIRGDKTILDDVSWLIGPGDRYAILGENGTGKTTLLHILDGSLTPTSGTVKIGKTVQMATLTQRLSELEPLREYRVLDVLEDYKQGYIIDGKRVSPTLLLEQLGFDRDLFQARIKDLSGGQKRRLQLMLTLLKEPNVLILDEPGNDFDTDMLALLEDLLDSWPGTLLLVSHDRYLVERTTDHQYALLNGTLRHCPGGVDEFLRLVKDKKNPHDQTSLGNMKAVTESDENSPLSAGEAYEARKQRASTERKMTTLEAQISTLEAKLLTQDPTDFEALGNIQADIQDHRSKLADLETTWLELSEQLEAL